MLSVILLILKIIGIALLVLLGILLSIVLLVLFVPIRYRVKVEHDDSIALEGGLSWLFHFFHGRISQSGSNRRIWLRIMGILVYDSSRPLKAKKLKNEENIANDIKKETATEEGRKLPGEKMTLKDETKSGNVARSKDAVPQDVIMSKDNIAFKDATISGNVGKEESAQEETYPWNTINEGAHKEKAVYVDKKADDINSNNADNDKSNFFRKITEGCRKIKLKIISFINKIRSRIKSIIQKLINIKDKAGLIYNFINDDNNKKGFRFTYESIKKALKHVLPRKLKSRIIFGTGDPCSTGQILGILGILYGIYGDHLQITPDFENKVFKGSHYAKGRIRIWTLLIIIIKLLLDKRFKDLRTNYQLLKEAL